MPSIDRKVAEAEIAKLKNQKKPKVYCVARYQDRLRGDSEKMTYSGYSICYHKKHYDALMNSPTVGGVDVLWESKKFKEDIAKLEDDDNLYNDFDINDFEGILYPKKKRSKHINS